MPPTTKRFGDWGLGIQGEMLGWGWNLSLIAGAHELEDAQEDHGVALPSDHLLDVHRPAGLVFNLRLIDFCI